MLLEVRSLSAGYGGGGLVVHDLALSIEEHAVVTIIGANGSGKSTLFKALMGLTPFCRGHISFAGQDIGRLGTDKRVKLGLNMIPQGREVFGPLTVEENLLMGGYLRLSMLRPKARLSDDFELAYTLFPVLYEKRGTRAALLSGGQQEMLAIARGLLSRPRLLLLDEPSLGLAPAVTDELAKVLLDLKQRGLTMVLVEQNAHLGLQIAQRGYVLNAGEIVAEGTAEELLKGGLVAQHYLLGKSPGLHRRAEGDAVRQDG